VTRQKQLTTGKAVFDVEFVLLHQQREMDSLKKQMDSQMNFLQARMDSHHDQVINMLKGLTVKVALPVLWGNVFLIAASQWG